jgi:hypothetical protein
MKKWFTNITSVFHKKEGHEAWNKTKYVVVLQHKRYDVGYDLGDEPFYKCVEFKTKEDALGYLDEYVSKVDRKYCHLYKEIKL